MKINLLTVCTDVYPIEYARKIIQRVQDLSDFDITPYCLTDRPTEVEKFATPIVRKEGIRGWWNKMMLHDPDLPSGWNLYLDIDIVLIKNFDEEIQYAIDADKRIACVSDAIGWMNNKFSSSMMLYRTGALEEIYHKFRRDLSADLQNFRGGDQVWTGQYLKDTDVLYIDETYPNLKKNLKFHLGEKVFGQWIFPPVISNEIKMVDCGGRPKPHELPHLKYIKHNWVNV